MYNKGISGIVATILLLLVAILTFISIQQWYLSNSSQIITQVEKQGVSNKLTQISQISPDTIFFRNSNGNIIDVTKITIGNTNCNYSRQLQLGFNKINITNCTSTISSGIKEVTIYTKSGIYSKSADFSTS